MVCSVKAKLPEGVSRGNPAPGAAGMLAEIIYNDLIARGKTLAVAKEWASVAAEFERVCGYKEEYSRQDLTLFLTHLRQRNLLQSTIDKDLKAIKLLSEIQGWTFPKLSLKPVSQDEITRNILEKEQVASLILMGKRLFTPLELCFLALATTYGLRRIEMAKLTETDFTPEVPCLSGRPLETITISTAKGGARTTQLIPPEISTYLCAFKPCKQDTLTHMFHRMLLKVGLKATGGFGWHSIRRSLATELILEDASALNVLRFMRWADASSRRELGMLAIYAKRDQAKIDECIFKIHPFLPFWSTAQHHPQRAAQTGLLRRRLRDNALEGDALHFFFSLVSSTESLSPSSALTPS